LRAENDVADRLIQNIYEEVKRDTSLLIKVAKGVFKPTALYPDVEIFPVISGWCSEKFMMKLLNAGSNLFSHQHKLPSAMGMIVSEENFACMRAILRFYEDRRATSEFYEQSSYLLRRVRSPAMVYALSALGVSVNVTTTDSMCPLWNAIHEKRFDIANALINCGADVSVRYGGYTTLGMLICSSYYPPRPMQPDIASNKLFITTLVKVVNQKVKLEGYLGDVFDATYALKLDKNQTKYVIVLVLRTGHHPTYEDLIACARLGTYGAFVLLYASITRGGTYKLFSEYRNELCTLIEALCNRSHIRHSSWATKDEIDERMKMLDFIAIMEGGYDQLKYFLKNVSIKIGKWAFGCIDDYMVTTRKIKEKRKTVYISLFDILECNLILPDIYEKIHNSIIQ
jgi:hypothetical protein